MKTFLLFCMAAAFGAQPAEARLILHRTAIIDAQLGVSLNSQTARTGKRFLLLTEKTRIGNTQLPAGSRLEGRVENVARATSRRAGSMDLLVEAVRLPNAPASPMRARLHFLAKTKSDVVLKKGATIHMQTIAEIAETIMLSAATPAKPRPLEAPPAIRSYDQDEQFPF